MFSLFRKDDSQSSPQRPADPNVSPNGFVPENLENGFPEASKVADVDGPIAEGESADAEATRATPSTAPSVAPEPPPDGQSQEDPLESPPRPSHASAASDASGPAGADHSQCDTSVADEVWRTTSTGDPAEHLAPAFADDCQAERQSEAERAVLTNRQRNRRLKGRRLARPEESSAAAGGRATCFTPQQRLLLLDTWLRSGLPAKDFAALVGISKHTLYKWKQRFQQLGPAGLMDEPRGARRGSRLPEVTKRAILMLKQQHPEWGCQRISDMLLRGPALPASPSAVARLLHEAGYELVGEPTRPHPPKKCRFERAKPNSLWQSDLFTFVLKRQNRRVYLVAFLDDHSRFIVSYGVHASASTALVLEALEAGISAWGPPEEILTDNGPQYVTWRGKSRFTRHVEKRGIRQIVARPRRPQTLGKIERFWGTLWREFLETAVFQDLGDARVRIGHFIDYYNLQRPHRALEGLVPADRFFGAAPEVLRTLKERVRANALDLARHGEPKVPFYVTGQIDGQSFSVHAEGQRLILRKEGERREEIELAAAAPGSSAPEQPPLAPASAEPSPPGDGSGKNDSLPGPVCPSGAPTDRVGEPACDAPLAPGQSALDEACLHDLRDTADSEEAGQPTEESDGEEGPSAEGGQS